MKQVTRIRAPDHISYVLRFESLYDLVARVWPTRVSYYPAYVSFTPHFFLGLRFKLIFTLKFPPVSSWSFLCF